MIKTLGILTFLLAAFLGSAVLAQEPQGRVVQCDEDTAYTIFAPEGIRARVIAMRGKVFVDTLKASQANERVHPHLRVTIVECPQSDFPVTILNVSEQRRPETRNPNARYELSVAENYLLHTDKVDIRREARRQGCLISTGTYDDSVFDPENPDERKMQECKMHKAYRVRDSNYAKMARARARIHGRLMQSGEGRGGKLSRPF